MARKAPDFEGINSQRGTAWRCSDSLSLRTFLGIPLDENAPDHSSLSYIRDRVPLDVHKQVFVKVLASAHEKKLLKGKSVAVDSKDAGSQCRDEEHRAARHRGRLE